MGRVRGVARPSEPGGTRGGAWAARQVLWYESRGGRRPSLAAIIARPPGRGGKSGGIRGGSRPSPLLLERARCPTATDSLAGAPRLVQGQPRHDAHLPYPRRRRLPLTDLDVRAGLLVETHRRVARVRRFGVPAALPVRAVHGRRDAFGPLPDLYLLPRNRPVGER